MVRGWLWSGRQQGWRQQRQPETGFTIIELMAVILVLAIITTITIVGYGAWEKNLAARTIKSDLVAAVSAMESAKTWGTATTGVYPSSLPSTYAASSSTKITGGGRLGGGTYCIEGESYDNPGVTYYVSNKQTSPIEGNCDVVSITKQDNSTTPVDISGTGYTGVTENRDMIFTEDGGIFILNSGRDVIYKVTDTSNFAVSSFSGTGVAGLYSGAANVTQFNNPYAMALDENGDFIVVDKDNSRLRQVGWDDGYSLTIGSMTQPTAIDIDSQGTMYIGLNGCKVIKAASYGVVTADYAGSGTCGFLDGAAASARFNAINDVAVDSKGNLYVADASDCRLRMVSTNGQVSTVAGTGTCGQTSGPALTSQLNTITSLAVDEYDNVWMASGQYLRIYLTDGTLYDAPLDMLNENIFTTTNMFLTFDRDGNLWAGGSSPILQEIVIP